MKIEFALFSLVLLLFAQACKKPSRQPETCFSKSQEDSIIAQAVRFADKLPPGANHETKFSKEFDWYYALAAREFDFRACAPDGDNRYYFLITRKARSIWPAREAIGGKLSLNERQKITGYEEIFRTWKMAEDSLGSRAFELFDLMVAGKDLTPYRTKFKGDRYIEFPDDRFYFDKHARHWRDRELDSLAGELKRML